MFSLEQRNVFAGIADVLIPAFENKPAASAVGIHTELLDAVLKFRPDLIDAVKRTIAFCTGRDPSEAINALFAQHRSDFDAFTLAATGGYYMSDTVRAAIGYPGQESPSYDPHETPDYLTDGTLERVFRRGAMYRPTPA